jgi:succinyl-diaminopimelate desuccinylase
MIVDKLNSVIESMKDDMVRAVQEIVEIKSVTGEPKPGMPFGEGVHEALRHALNLADTMGFRAVNLDGYMGYAEYGTGREMVGVLGHLDVVPEGDGWKYPPYGGEVHDGKIFGRGTLDDKGPIVAALFGLKAIKEANLPISRRVRIFFGTNEEKGSSEVPYYLERDEAPVLGFTPDAEYPIIYAEKGILILKVTKKLIAKPQGSINIKHIKGGNAPNMVPDFCEAVLEVRSGEVRKSILSRLEEYVSDTGYDISCVDREGTLVIVSRGVSAHGSVPHLGRNAVMQLLMFLSSLEIEGEAGEYIKFFSQNVGMEVKGETLGFYLEDETGELSLNLGVIELDEKEASVLINIRYPVTFKTSDVMDVFNERIDPLGAEVEITLEQHPLYFPKDHPLIEKLQKVYKEQTGTEPELLAIGGGTYAKEMPNIVAFGPIFPGKPDLDHQANEYIEIEDLLMNAKIYGNAIYELAR